MGVFDKIKNIFFEEEYVEVEEEVNKPKKEIKKEKVTVAKKIDLPEIKKEKPKEKIKEEEIEEEFDEEETEEEFESSSEPKQENKFKFPMTFEEEDFKIDTMNEEEEPPRPIYKEEQTRSLYGEETKKEEPKYIFENERVPLYEGREDKKDKPIFRPTPIISPIYGILDKNYKKEEIVTKKPIVLSTSSSRKMDLDQVREKAYGDLASDITASMEEEKEVYSDIEEDDVKENTFYDLNINSPAVERVTVGDAEEYFNDLGLEYNVDYKDNSIERATGRRTAKLEKKELEDEDDTSLENNLFDLIESMYEDKEE